MHHSLWPLVRKPLNYSPLRPHTKTRFWYDKELKKTHRYPRSVRRRFHNESSLVRYAKTGF